MGDYATLAEVRAEGLPLPTEGPSDARLLAAIGLASRQIEEWTGWWFEPRSLTLQLDGPGDHRTLYIPQPIISVTAIKRLDAAGTVVHTYTAADFKAYNRHLSYGPDDRRNPRIEFVQEGPYSDATVIRSPYRYGETLCWPEGQLNFQVEGKFGYTDPDPAALVLEGVTPAMIKRACVLLVLRQVWPAYSHGDLNEDADRRRITSERTRDQAWEKANPWTGGTAGVTGIGYWTGDPEIDRIIQTYRRPAGIAAI